VGKARNLRRADLVSDVARSAGEAIGAISQMEWGSSLRAEPSDKWWSCWRRKLKDAPQIEHVWAFCWIRNVV